MRRCGGLGSVVREGVWWLGRCGGFGGVVVGEVW